MDFKRTILVKLNFISGMQSFHTEHNFEKHTEGYVLLMEVYEEKKNPYILCFLQAL